MFGIDFAAVGHKLQNAAASCVRPPADPRAAGFKPGKVDAGPNGFKLGIEGPDPMLRIGGTHDQQEHQRDVMLGLSTRALASYTTGHTPLTPRYPSDSDVSGMLAQLHTNPPIGTDGVDVTHAVYQSTIPNSTPQEAYAHFVNQPGEVFSAGGMEIRPPTSKLEDGGRYMLEIGGPVPTWLPVQIRLDPAQHAITIDTLDGHVLRGTQTFQFDSNCDGGTVLTQDAHFQGSTELVGDMQQLASVSEGQHQTWENAHREIFEHFNGDSGYAGMGTGVFNEQQLSSWKETLSNLVRQPGTAVDTMFDVGGEIANETLDHWSGWAGQALERSGIPGGNFVRQAGDTAGDLTSKVVDTAGNGAKKVVDFLTPW